jgi:hypothetical protein
MCFFLCANISVLFSFTDVVMLENLRKHAFQYALENMPVVLDEYHPIHVASLLNDSSSGDGAAAPGCALHALRKQLSGEKLISLQPDGIAKICSKFDCDSDETNRSIQLLLDLLKEHTDGNTLSVPAVHVSPALNLGIEEEDLTKKHIHISTFDKKADAAEEKKINAAIDKSNHRKKKETAMAKKRRKKLEEKDKDKEKDKEKERQQEPGSDVCAKSESVLLNNENNAEEEFESFVEMSKTLEVVSKNITTHLTAADESSDDDEDDVEGEEVPHSPLGTTRTVHSSPTQKKKKEKKKTVEQGGRGGERAAIAAAKQQQQLLYDEQNKLFLHQMSSMQEVLKTHTHLVKSLKEQNIQLQHDNRAAERKVQRANEVAREQEQEHQHSLQVALQQRDQAAQSLSFVTDRYVDDLKEQIQHQQPPGQHPNTTEVYVPPPPQSRPLSYSAPPPAFEETPHLLRQPSQNQLSTSHTHSSSSSSLSLTSSQHRPSSPSQRDQMLAMHDTPVRTARFSVITAAEQRTEEDFSGPPDIVAQMAKDAEYEIHQWRKLLKVYKFSHQPLDIGDYDDAEATMRSALTCSAHQLFITHVTYIYDVTSHTSLIIFCAF